MLITDVTAIKLRYPMDVAMADAIHYMPDRPVLLVRVHTDEGIVGLGEVAVNRLLHCTARREKGLHP